MKTTLTPLEIQQQRFTIKFRGYNTSEVDLFLDQVCETLEVIMNDAEGLREKIRTLTQENQEHKSREESYKRVMLNSQKVLEQMKDNAKKSSDLIVAQAEVDAERIIQSAHDKLARMHDEINELKRQHIQFRTQMKSVIDSHSELLDMTYTEIDAPEEEIRQIDYD